MNLFNFVTFNNTLQSDDTSDIPKIEEVPDNTYECSSCGTPVQVDPFLTYTYHDLQIMDKQQKYRMNYWHGKYAYSKEIEPNKWLTFCRRVCEVKYNRQYEEGWEYSRNKK